ncbi:unnamed protein product [Periconia digitata]|uniref:Uncharacterized protein n=1 Tax=Periconia digitata TaxID=1303443 RepID=A0A9W4XU65_9PLEO|nr:unnamed protein product [Periconia digitata]
MTGRWTRGMGPSPFDLPGRSNSQANRVRGGQGGRDGHGGHGGRGDHQGPQGHYYGEDNSEWGLSTPYYWPSPMLYPPGPSPSHSASPSLEDSRGESSRELPRKRFRYKDRPTVPNNPEMFRPPRHYTDQSKLPEGAARQLCMNCFLPSSPGHNHRSCNKQCALCGTTGHHGQVCPHLYLSWSYHNKIGSRPVKNQEIRIRPTELEVTQLLQAGHDWAAKIKPVSELRAAAELEREEQEDLPANADRQAKTLQDKELEREEKEELPANADEQAKKQDKELELRVQMLQEETARLQRIVRELQAWKEDSAPMAMDEKMEEANADDAWKEDSAPMAMDGKMEEANADDLFDKHVKEAKAKLLFAKRGVENLEAVFGTSG